jgi:hypothetical protein
VTVNDRGGKVEVTRGQVQVADFKSGQFALVLPGQTAGVDAKGNSGLTLSGSGTFNPVQQGQPRASDIKLIRPEHGSLPPPKDSGPAKALRLINAKSDGLHSGAAPRHAVLVDSARANANHANVNHATGLRIAAPLGEVHVNFQKVTNGLAHDTSSHQSGKNGEQASAWGSSGTSGSGNAVAGNAGGSGVSVVAGASSPSGSSGVSAQIGAANKSSNGNNGNGNNGNGNGNGNGGVGNGNGKGNGKH